MFQEFLSQNILEELLGGPGAFHPYPVCKEREPWQALPEETQKILIDFGNEALEGYPQLTASQYMAYTRTGERKVFETPYFARRKRLFYAVLAECVENSGRFMDAVIDGLWLICEESTWVVSAHNYSDPDEMLFFSRSCLPDDTNPYIDLFAAQTASVLAYALYFLEEKLNDVSPLIAARVRREIHKRILHPFLTRSDFWWMGYGARTINNWNPWILSNVIDTVLITETDQAYYYRAIKRAMMMLDHYLAAMPEDGGCDEGAGYFNAAGASLLDCLESLYCASNEKIDFYHIPHIAAIGTYPEKVHIAGSYYLNFADCDAKPFVDGERLYTYGKRTGNQRLMELGSAIFGDSSDRRRQLSMQDTPQVNRLLFSLFAPPDHLHKEPEPAPFMQLPDLQVFAWNQHGLYAAIKGGHNDESHNHNDVGTFMVYADGEPEIIDMGNKVYTAATFGPNRYQLNNTRSMNHNIPLVADSEQHAGREYAAGDVSASAQGAVMNIAGAYPSEACLNKLERSFVPCDGVITLRDQISLVKPQGITWVFMLRNKPSIDSGEAFFGKLKMKFDPSLTVKTEEIIVDDQRMQRSFPGSLWRLTLHADEALMHDQTFVIKRR